MGAFSEAVGGIFLLLGLQTRVFSFLIFCTMLVAIFLQQWSNGTWNTLPALGFGWVSLFTMVLGSGRFGLDHLISKKIKSMKKYQLLFITLLVWSVSSCVQKSYKKTIIIKLTVHNFKDIKTVGIRGNGNPLSWDKDFPLQPLVKDSLYGLTATVLTGYKFAEIKFTVNGEFELKNRPNRRVVFSDKDTTYYNAVFNLQK